MTRKLGTCFHCRKPGHFSRDCRTRQAEERNSQSHQLPLVKHEFVPQPNPAPITDMQARTPSGPRTAKREITCFNCQQKGHKSPQCPQKQHVKCVQIPAVQPILLKDNELMGSIGAHVLPVTCDSGADVTIVPEECVQEDEFTGETCEVSSFNRIVSSGRTCNVAVMLGGRRFQRRAVAQPGKDLGWTICLSLPYRDKEDREFISGMMDSKFDSVEERRMYLPPMMEDGVVHATLMVGAGATNDAAAHTSHSSLPVGGTDLDVVGECPEEGLRETGEEVVVRDEVEREQSSSVGLCIEMNASDVVEADGASSAGSAVREGSEEDLVLEGIHQLGPETLLARETKADSTLAHVRSLANLDKEGYHWKRDIVYRTRLDRQGEPVEQICVPQNLRQKCLVMAHGRFGHQGRNKMMELLRPYFYWPSMSKDRMLHIRACETCQKQDKAVPKPSPMQLRELSSVLFENISIDIVGPFPTAVGGFKYLLTAVDLATRWPEAIPLKSTTVKVITKNLMSIFSHCGFPARITTDNGPQFKGDSFSKWAKRQGIQHVFSSPYHPQGNGVVERLHRTLNAMVAKMTDKKGNWANAIPKAMYFLRSTPCSATGMSPFMARQGWEPATPLDLLYKAWAEQDEGNLDLVGWVDLNIERVETLRDKAVAALAKSASDRKERWDRKAKSRTFQVGDKVLVRKPGMCAKLEETWDGPFTITRVNSPLSYAVDFGYRKSPSIHVQLLKRFQPKEETRVARVTSVLEPDGPTDDIRDRLASVEVEHGEMTSTQKRDVEAIEKSYSNILTKDPGCTDRVCFSIDTGDSAPLFQRAYNTPIALREHIERIYPPFFQPVGFSHGGCEEAGWNGSTLRRLQTVEWHYEADTFLHASSR